MPWQRIMFIIALFSSSTITGTLAFFAYRRRRQTGAKEFFALMVTLTLYLFGNSFEFLSNTLSQVMFWNKIEYLGIAFIPLFWIMLVSNYIGISKRVKFVIFCFMLAVSTTILAANFTNNFHHQYYLNVEFNTAAPFPVALYTTGPWGWVYLIYLYSSLFGGNILLIVTLARTAKLYRSQIYSLILSSLVTWLGSIIYWLGFTPYQIDPSPFTFTVTGLILSWGIFRYKLLDLSPIARGIVFGTMRDGVLTLDLQNRLLDYNPAAGSILKELTPSVIGRDIADILGNDYELINQIHNNIARSEFYISQEKGGSYVESRLSQILSNTGVPVGKIIILNDITTQRETQIKLIQTEKMTTLGQLVSNVVHEMNTSLAAIKATAENIEQSFESYWLQLDNFLDGFSDRQKQLCLRIIQKNYTPSEFQSIDEGIALEKLTPVLQAQKIEDARDLARYFVELGIAEEFVNFIPVIQDNKGRSKLRFVLEIALERRKINRILLEEERTAKIIYALKSYSHPSV